VLREAQAPGGFYKGVPTSPHTVKAKTEFQGIPVHIDRPKGFVMRGTDAQGRDWARRYLYDYGFIPKTLGGDGDGLDVFIGPDKNAQIAFWAVQRKDDGTFDEYKVFLGFPDRDAAIAAYRQHIPKKYFKGIMAMKVEMMKAMLGQVDPDVKFKRASAFGFIDELGWLLRTGASS
jgi:inorganic pyrophosphatase-like protein/inorganic pyrophosphatase